MGQWKGRTPASTMQRGMFTLLVLLIYFVNVSEEAKGGAKSMVNGRKNQRSRGGGGGGGNNDEVDEGEGIANSDRSLDFKNRPCVGICHYMRMKGISVEKQFKDLLAKKRKRPCVGLCFIMKKKKLEKIKKRKLELLKKKELESLK